MADNPRRDFLRRFGIAALAAGGAVAVGSLTSCAVYGPPPLPGEYGPSTRGAPLDKCRDTSASEGRNPDDANAGGDVRPHCR
jgi:hypothetical protein